MARGFRSRRLITELQKGGWRFVLRVKSNWRMAHPDYTGQMRHAGAEGLVGTEPRLYTNACLGYDNRGGLRGSCAHVVSFFGAGHKEPWFLVTSETDPHLAVKIYRQRMRIEEEFRDL